MPRHNRFRCAIVFLIFACAAVTASAQTVVYDWSSDSKVPESYPRITRRQTVWFRITNVNDILYSYRLEVTQTPIEGNDFAHLEGLLKHFRQGGTKSGQLSQCQALQEEAESLTNTAIEKINDDPKLPVGYAKTRPHVSVPVNDSIKAWENHQPAVTEALEAIKDYRDSCTNQIPSHLNSLFTDFETTVQNLDKKVNSDHVFIDKHEIAPGNNVSVVVVEMFGAETIKTKTFTFPGVDVLTLSAGSIFSAIPDRAYEARKSPTSDLNLLTVEGNSRATPSLVALLNYSLGSIGLDHDTAGLALSAGPVLKLGGKSDTSSFGFFAGVSGHLYHRFYITPGIHFGQFADFPVGFGNGSTVPANFGELTPVKRWTARFGLALSFKTKDFSGLGDSDTPSVTGNEASGPAKPQPASPSTSPSPSPETNANVLNLSNAPLGVAADFLRLPSPRPSVVEPRREPIPAQRISERPAKMAENVSPATREAASSPATATSITQINSITSLIASPEAERVVLEAAVPIREYTVHFKNGRFFLSIPHARLDVFQDGLSGHTFTDPRFEQSRDRFVISFALAPGTKAQVREQSNGLALVFVLVAQTSER